VLLVEISLRGFQSYRAEQRVPIAPNLTLIAGRNNVGKSALMRALLIWLEQQEGLASDFRLSYTWSIARAELGTAVPGLEQIPQWPLLPPVVRLVVSIESNQAGQATGNDLRITKIALGDQVAAIPGDNQQLVWSGLPSPSNTAGLAGLGDLAKMSATNVVYVAPRHIDLRPGQHVYSETTLRPDGQNLANVLRYIREADPRKQWAELMAFMRQAFPDIEDLTVPTVPDQSTAQGEPMVYYRGLENGVPLRLSGTGVQQLLALSAALICARGSRLVLIDEPQAYLHPHAERALVRLMSDKSQHQYIVATHSSALLSASPLSSTRLLTLTDTGTELVDVGAADDLLSELGFTAADLWLPEAILWVEGPSDAAALQALMACELDQRSLGIAVRPMPAGASQFVGTSSRRAEAAYRFCEAAVAAVAPLSVPVSFLFDRDAKTDAIISRLAEVSGGRAHFLPVRELENLFLDGPLLQLFINQRRTAFDLPELEPGAVQNRLTALLADSSNTKLFPSGIAQGEDPLDVVKGSAVLGVLCDEMLASEYQKVEDGRWLAETACRERPERLNPLRNVLAGCASS